MQIITVRNYVDKAEEVIKSLSKSNRGDFKLTTSQLRNLITLSSDILDETNAVMGDALTLSLEKKLANLRVQFVYRSGREQAVKEFTEKSKALEIIKDIKTKEDLLLFCRYLEALVAYKKFFDPKDS